MKVPKAHGRPPVNAFSAALEYPTTRCNSHTPSSPRMRPSRTKFSAKPPCCQRKAWRRLLTFFFSLARADYLNRGASGVCDQIRSVESRLPFALQGFDCDNGSEFLNFHLQRYFSDRPREIAFTRSRPYKKNDNAHVEQKNWTHVRHLFGYDRIDKPELVPLQRVNARYQKHYDAPKTPYQRLLDSPCIEEETKRRLQDVHQALNPFILKQEIERKLVRIFRQIKVTSNVRQRL